MPQHLPISLPLLHLVGILFPHMYIHFGRQIFTQCQLLSPCI